ncbi:MAG: Sporulation inhibitor [Paenibacillaceae bacterium]|nr:Sporulation inhibitor [Paenibacillaceae bacterium]
MRMLSNEILIDSYFRAQDLKLEKEFIELLLKEIKRRKLPLPNHYSQAQAN